MRRKRYNITVDYMYNYEAPALFVAANLNVFMLFICVWNQYMVVINNMMKLFIGR